MKRFTWLFAILLLSLVLAACTGTAEPATSPVAEAAAASEEASMEEAEDADEAEDAMAEEDMMDAKSIAGIASADDAFAALPEGTIEALLEDPQGDLNDILLYHVVEGAVPAEIVVTLDSAPTLQGSEVTISVGEDGVILNDSVKVILTDIIASNGIIHVIDGVLLPPAEEANTAQSFVLEQAQPTHAACGSGNNA